jgi:hypothetical protein
MIQSPLYFPVASPDWYIGVTSLFALLTDPEGDASEERWRTVDALGSWFHKQLARRFGKERADPEFRRLLENQQMDNRIYRSWRQIVKRLIAAELVTRVLLRMARRAAYPCGIVVADRLPGEEADMKRLHLLFGGAADAAGSPPRATITSVIRDHVQSIGADTSNIFSRIWTPSKPVLHLAIALSVDVEETYPGEAQWGKQLSVLANPSWLADCIHRAEVFRTVHAPLIASLGIGPHEMIQVLPANS